jgi:hypothetical protein
LIGEINQPGAFVLGESALPNEKLLSSVINGGVQAHSFVRA